MVVENPVQLVIPETVQDYVVLAPPATEQPVLCSQYFIGLVIMLLGVLVGVGAGVIFGKYYNQC